MFDVPVILVGNKIDQWGDRMVSVDDGQRRAKEIACACFHEISVRESVEQVSAVFVDACRFWRVFSKFPKLKRSASDVPNGTEIILSPDCICSILEMDRKGDYEILRLNLNLKYLVIFTTIYLINVFRKYFNN